MENKKYICCCSGGKDSSAMFLKLIEQNRPLDLVIICDIKEEYDFLKHNQQKIKEICEKHNIECVMLKEGSFVNKKGQLIKYPLSFEYILFNHYKFFPYFACRWCTDWMKVKPMRNFMKARFGKDKQAYYQYIGYAKDEENRIKLGGALEHKEWLYPLIEYNMTEKDCYKYAMEHGFKFDTRFKRSGCWCCPLMNCKEIKTLINYYPEKWQIIKDWEKKLGRLWKENTTKKYGGTEYDEKKLKDDQIYIIDKDETNL